MWITSSQHGSEIPKSLSTLTFCLKLLTTDQTLTIFPNVSITCPAEITRPFLVTSLLPSASPQLQGPLLTSVIIAGRNLTKYFTAAIAIVVSLCLLSLTFPNQDLFCRLKREKIQKHPFLDVN